MMKQPVGSSSSSWVVLPCRKGLMARRLSMVCFFDYDDDCDDLVMTAAFREDVGEEETQLGGAGGGKTRLDGCAHGGKRERERN